jgi:hypothetical protein
LKEDTNQLIAFIKEKQLLRMEQFMSILNCYQHSEIDAKLDDLIKEILETVTASEGLGDIKITEAPCDLYFSSYGSSSH